MRYDVTDLNEAEFFVVCRRRRSVVPVLSTGRRAPRRWSVDDQADELAAARELDADDCVNSDESTPSCDRAATVQRPARHVVVFLAQWRPGEATRLTSRIPYSTYMY